MNVTVTIDGAVTGTMWMPAVEGAVQVRECFTLRGVPMAFRPPVASIREAVERTAAKDGDFQTAGKLTADTAIHVERRKGNKLTRRTYYVTDFATALADFIAEDVCFCDMLLSEDDE